MLAYTDSCTNAHCCGSNPYTLDIQATQLYPCVVVPDFNGSGNLPTRVHWADWADMSNHFGRTPHRQRLLSGFRQALEALRVAGCETVYLDGSFVTSKNRPRDFDACWDVMGVDVERLDPVLLDFSNGRAAQKARFGGELFPAQFPNGSSGRTFLEFFKVDKQTGDPKGIIALDLRTWQP